LHKLIFNYQVVFLLFPQANMSTENFAALLLPSSSSTSSDSFSSAAQYNHDLKVFRSGNLSFLKGMLVSIKKSQELEWSVVWLEVSHILLKSFYCEMSAPWNVSLVSLSLIQ
jgi:hypothetical protein